MYILVLLISTGLAIDVAAYESEFDCWDIVYYLAIDGVESECVPEGIQ